MTTIAFVVGLVLGFMFRGWAQNTFGLFKSKKQKTEEDEGPTDGIPVRGAKWVGKKFIEGIFGKPGKKKDKEDS